MKVIVGGVERVISQVDTFVMYGGKVETVGQVLEDSRADRLMKKEFQKKTVHNLTHLDEYQTLPSIATVNPKIMKSRTSVVKKAKHIEKIYSRHAK
jgi:hypothetical protein